MHSIPARETSIRTRRTGVFPDQQSGRMPKRALPGEQCGDERMTVLVGRIGDDEIDGATPFQHTQSLQSPQLLVGAKRCSSLGGQFGRAQVFGEGGKMRALGFNKGDKGGPA